MRTKACNKSSNESIVFFFWTETRTFETIPYNPREIFMRKRDEVNI